MIIKCLCLSSRLRSGLGLVAGVFPLVTGKGWLVLGYGSEEGCGVRGGFPLVTSKGWLVLGCRVGYGVRGGFPLVTGKGCGVWGNWVGCGVRGTGV